MTRTDDLTAEQEAEIVAKARECGLGVNSPLARARIKCPCGHLTPHLLSRCCRCGETFNEARRTKRREAQRRYRLRKREERTNDEN